MNTSTQKRSPVDDKHLRHAGQYSDEKIEIITLKRVRNFTIFIMFAAVATYEVLHAYFNLSLQPVLALSVALIVGIYIFYEDIKLRKEAKKYLQGSSGEKKAAEILDNLRTKDCVVFHDIPMDVEGKIFNIDHVIISKHGIFAFETKTPSKPKGNPEITTNGVTVNIPGNKSSDSDIQETIYHAVSLSKELFKNTGKRLYVQPVLIYPGWLVKEYTEEKIWILNPNRVGNYVELQRNKLNDEDFNLIREYLTMIIKNR